MKLYLSKKMNFLLLFFFILIISVLLTKVVFSAQVTIGDTNYTLIFSNLSYTNISTGQNIPVNLEVNVTSPNDEEYTYNFTIEGTGFNWRINDAEVNTNLDLINFSEDKSYVFNLTIWSDNPGLIEVNLQGILNNDSSILLNSTEDLIFSVNVFNSFISKWNTSAVSENSSNSTSVMLPLEEFGFYDFMVYWGDGNFNNITIDGPFLYKDSILVNNITHNYAEEGIYNITIFGEIEGFGFNNQGDRLKIIDIFRWGELRLGNSGGYFYGCSNLDVSANDFLNTTEMYNMEEALYKARLSDKDLMRRTFHSRLQGAYTVFYGFRLLKLPIKYYIYCFKPLVAGLVPRSIMMRYHKKKYS